MATTTTLEVQQDLLRKGHKFVLTSRFTQDCLENTFYCIRQRNSVPTPVEFHYALQLFRSKTTDSLMESSNVVAQLEREAMSLHSTLPSCHELKKKIVTTYIRLRLRIQSKCSGAERKANIHDKGHLGSKSQTKKATSNRQTSSPKVTTSRPLPNTFLVAMDTLGLFIPSTLSAASSLPQWPQPAVATSGHSQQAPAAVPSTSSSKHEG